jgi:hypothetical protein
MIRDLHAHQRRVQRRQVDPAAPRGVTAVHWCVAASSAEDGCSRWADALAAYVQFTREAGTVVVPALSA